MIQLVRILLLLLQIQLSIAFSLPGRSRVKSTQPPSPRVPTLSPDRYSPGRCEITALQLLPNGPLVNANDSWGNWSVLTGTAMISQVIGKKTTIGRLLGAPVTAMAATFFLASVGILAPGGTSAAKSLQLLSLQLATPLVLLGADLRDAGKRCGPLLVSFAAAAGATMIASFLGWYLSGNLLQNALGLKDSLTITAALMAKNIGGGINYVAVCRSLGASPAAVAAGLCVDNIFALIYFPATSYLGAGRGDIKVSEIGEEDATTALEEAQDYNQQFSTELITALLFLSSALLWLGERIGGTAGALPFCTILTVLFASLAPSRLMQPLRSPANTLGACCLYLFFATAGAPGIAVSRSVRASILPLSLFLTTLYGVHGTILALLHKFFPEASAFQPQRLLIASSSAIGGPATSLALAQTHGWSSLEVPGLIVGNIGYAVATFLALAYYAVLSR